MRTMTMAHLVDRHFVERANTVLLLSVLWGAFAACVIGALVYDLAIGSAIEASSLAAGVAERAGARISSLDRI